LWAGTVENSGPTADLETMKPPFGEDQPLVDRTVASSFLAETPAPLRDRLFETAELMAVGPGTLAYRPYEPAAGVLILSGLLRSFLVAPDGRQMTVKYGVPGDLFGVPALVGGPVPVAVEAMEETRAVRFDPQALEALVRDDGATGWRLAQEIGGDFCDLMVLMAENLFDPVPVRVARHLLFLAVPDPVTRLPTVNRTQGELAQAVGSVREVVSRVLKKFEAEGLVETGRSGIAVTNVAGLKALTRPVP
jgi:CRP-like cAMP-binding protein